MLEDTNSLDAAHLSVNKQNFTISDTKNISFLGQLRAGIDKYVHWRYTYQNDFGDLLIWCF